MFLYKVILINGVYDIICGLTILEKINIKMFKNLHKKMFKNKIFFDKQSDQLSLNKNLLGFFILSHGFIRFSSSFLCLNNNFIITNCLNKPVNLNLNQEINVILIISYILESMFCLNEMLYYDNIYIDKAFYVSYSSILLAILIVGYT